MPDQAEMRKSHEKQNMETDEESRNCDSAGRSHAGGTIEPKLTLGADFLPGQAPFIDQSVFWKDIESGQAELGIRIRGLNEWLPGRRFSEDKEKNEKWDDEFHKD